MEQPIIHLNFTCNRDWEDIQPVKNGRFCNDCQKIVVDFTNKTNDKIAVYLLSSTTKVCGRFQDFQLAPALPQPLWKRWLSAAAVFVAVFMGIKEASAQTSFEQDASSRKDSVVSFGVVEKLPEFPEGEKALINYLHKNLRQPKGVQGRVIMSFVVEKDGSLTEIKVLRKLSKEADEEAIRVLQKSPKWKPSSQLGILVRVAYTMPVNFGKTSYEK